MLAENTKINIPELHIYSIHTQCDGVAHEATMYKKASG